MHSEFKVMVAKVRAQVKALRAQQKLDTQGRLRKASFYRDDAVKQRVLATQAQLSYLAPLHRAMNALALQAGLPNCRGIAHYTKVYGRLRALMEQHLYLESRLQRFFAGAVSDLEIVIPDKDSRAGCWVVTTIGAMLKQISDEAQANKKESIRLSRAAETARQVFLMSLTANQRALLRGALELVAQQKSYPSISIDRRDYPLLGLKD